VTGGLLCKGLACLIRVEVFDEAAPGEEYEDIDVAFDEILNAGDPV